jgi:hypothetical protein
VGGGLIERRTIVAAVVAPIGGLTAVAMTVACWGQLPDPGGLRRKLRFDLRDGTTVAVTVNRAATAVEALSALLAPS